jgi:hypothetical protein
MIFACSDKLFRTLDPAWLAQEGIHRRSLGTEGGLVAIQLIEQHPDWFAAGLALCAPADGASKQIKDAADFRVVFDYFFPDVFPFGASNVPPDAFKDWETVYVPPDYCRDEYEAIAMQEIIKEVRVRGKEKYLSYKIPLNPPISPLGAPGGGFFTLSGVVVAVGIEPTTSRM